MSVKSINLGCRLNAYESERMEEQARAAGLESAVIVNTCAVTENAVKDSKRAIRRAARSNETTPILVTGCAAQINPDAFEQIEGVTSLVGNADKLRPESWRQIAQGQALNMSKVMESADLPSSPAQSKSKTVRAMVQVQNGCDHRCTFCIIPFGRGNSRSVPAHDVVKKVKRLVELGHKEVVLTGVDLTSWGGDLEGKPQLGELIQTILDKVPDLPQLRISSIDAIEIDAAFKEVLAEPRLAPYLHLSLQHGDTLILKRMKRRHTREEAVELCHELRRIRPDIAFGADLIAGFPTETESHFQNTLNLIDDCELAFVHAFPFSPRPDTPAARMPQLDAAIIKDRAARLRDKAKAALSKHLSAYVGAYQHVLIEHGNKGRMADFTQIELDPSDTQIGEFASVYLYDHQDSVLMGRVSDTRLQDVV